MRLGSLSARLAILVGIISTLVATVAVISILLLVFLLTERSVKKSLEVDATQIIQKFLLVEGRTISLKNSSSGEELANFIRGKDLSLDITYENSATIAKYGIYRNLGRDSLTNLESIKSKNGIYFDRVLEEYGQYDIYITPLKTSENIVGYLQLARQNYVLPVLKNAFNTVALTLLPIIWIVSGIVALFGTRKALAPFNKLVEFMENMDTENLSKKISTTESMDREIKVLTESFNSMTARIALSFNRQKRLAANISHEFKTPLARAVSSLEVVMTTLTSKNKISIGKIKNDLLQLGAKVDDLLETSLLMRTSKEKPKITNVARLVGSLVDDIPKNIKLTLNIPANFKIPLSDSYTQILLRNLIDNAVKYNIQHGYVLISAKYELNNWFINIENSTSGEKHNRGYGLGIAIVSDICLHKKLTIKYKTVKSGIVVATLSGKRRV
ncbi:MAG: HAMP domain-containing histidine kinase [Candidatus Woesebacteria bacterium]|nr:MAG: HAMP domain-containing histidine kinase [Candidatus Woesebacteria bacterium]